MQLELPLVAAPVGVPAGTLLYIQLGTEIVGYRLRRARRGIRRSPKSRLLSGKKRAGC